jgi:hypothetical protein
MLYTSNCGFSFSERKSYVEIRNKRIEETLLEKIGLTTKEFGVS